MENAKLILSVGSLRTDFNTGNFTYRIVRASTVEVACFSRRAEHDAHFTSAAFGPHTGAICTLPWTRNETSPP